MESSREIPLCLFFATNFVVNSLKINYNMSGIRDTATVTVTLDNEQARKALDYMEKQVVKLSKEYEELKAKGADAKVLEKKKRELSKMKKQLDENRAAVEGVKKAMQSLDKATPRELQKAIAAVNRQLRDTVPGTEKWKEHIRAMKQLRAQMDLIKSQMKEQDNLWQRFSKFWFQSGQAIAAVVMGANSARMSLNNFVNDYAEMEEQMASTVKFTGLSAETVRELNEEFKKMDTRTSREDLNKLAQEAGRLGKSSKNDVLEFVRAANVINVALDDLGEGATLTLSKLTGIFGDEKRLGTEKALLSVGSVINELSQNCAASAPYIAEFASRMGGVGSQAGMTVQQIMAFAAVLDSNNQKVEASSTALSQIITRIYQDPAKYAKVAGIEVDKFTALVKTDMNAALLLFLETLSKAGKMDTLSPMFKDMGETGARAIAALSTLAGHIDDVKSQQIVANEAFEEGTSVLKEYEVFNNTAQGSIDKARKSFRELSVELGERLAPMMKYMISSTSVMASSVLTVIDFFQKYGTTILWLTAIIALNNIQLNFTAVRLRVVSFLTDILTKKTLLHIAAQKTWNVVVGLGKTVAATFGVVIAALTNAVQYFTNGMYVNYTMQQRWRNAIAAFSGAGWISALVAIGVAIVSVTNKIKAQREEEARARKEREEYIKSITDLGEATARYSSNEISRLNALYQAAIDEAKSKDERRAAAEKLQALYPDYFKNLSTEDIMLGKAKTQYDNLRDSIIEVARARAAAEKIRKNEEELISLGEAEADLKAQADKDRADYKKKSERLNKARSNENLIAPTFTNSSEAAGSAFGAVFQKSVDVEDAYEKMLESQREYVENQEKQKQLRKANDDLAKKYNITAEELTEPEIKPEPKPLGEDKSDKTEERFAKEKEARERAEAEARIDYATGKKNYLEYLDAMSLASVNYYKALLNRTDLSELERLKIEAEYQEALKKQSEQSYTKSADEEQQSYNERKAQLKQDYIDGLISKQTYDKKIEELEIKHQKALVDIYADGSKEKQQAEEQLQSLLFDQTQRKQKESEERARKLSSMKTDFFGDNPQEKQAKYDESFAILQEVYENELKAAADNAVEKLRIEEAFEKAKIALKKKYGLETSEEEISQYQQTIENIGKWLESDGGKALKGALDTLNSGMSSIFSGLSEIVQAEMEIQTAKIERRYEKEIESAQGNSYRVAKLEKKKEEEIARVKNEANRKTYNMQVMQAIAQTATNALNAYGSAAAVPIIGYILAPIAAAAAVAAGMIQVQAIKKQQQASEAQGYASGGFTPKGPKFQEVGVVHAGEWVASQELLNSPVARPLIEALDYAQRTNTIGSLGSGDVSRSITAPAQMSLIAERGAAGDSNFTALSRYYRAIERLNERLDEPFVTVNTVTGEKGIKKAQEDFDKLIANKSKRR